VKKLNELFGKTIDPKEMDDLKEAEFEENLHRAVEIKVVADIVRTHYGKLPMAVGTGSSKRLALKILSLVGLN